MHAFLDEVFDGRDMLLRSALNVLQEREFKQGTRTTRGRIECSLMTSNRYLAEVLESSRQTLLAFVDRILSAPRLGHARVAFDFWQQFDAFEALEDIRKYRPSAFKALPEAPA